MPREPLRISLTPLPYPWRAEPMRPNEPEGGWQVRASSMVGDGSPGIVLAQYLSRRDAEDIVAGVHHIAAQRRLAAEDPLNQ